MKKKIFLRSLSGFPLGVTIGYFITIIISLIWAGGYYSPCVPELVDVMGNEINAVILQAVLCGVLGMGFGGSSVIWEIEDWGIAKQTGIYFLIVALVMMPIAYVTFWMEHSMKGALSYFGIFAAIFVIVWIIQYTIFRHTIKKMNENLHRG
ncbi:MAG: DUF3021 domain-containing protein [Clostridiales bacterium]|nr:DUF3021 domain-containing protein [Clostridiales bacterium]